MIVLLIFLANFVGIMEQNSVDRWSTFFNLSKRWVESNPYLIKGGAKPWAMIGLKVETSEVLIDLNEFNYEYFNMHIKDKLDGYVDAFTIKVESLLKEYLKAINESSGKFTLVYKYRMREIEKQVEIYTFTQ